MLKDFQINIVSHVFLDKQQFGNIDLDQRVGLEIVKAIQISYENIVKLLIIMFGDLDFLGITKALIMELWYIYSLLFEYEKRFLNDNHLYTKNIKGQFSNLKNIRDNIAHADERIVQVFESLEQKNISLRNKCVSKNVIKYSDPNQRNNVLVAGRMNNITSFGPGCLFSFGGFAGNDFVITDKPQNDFQLIKIDIQNKGKRIKIKEIIQSFFDSLKFDQDWKQSFPNSKEN